MKKSKNLKKLLAAVLVFFTLSIFIAIPGISADLVVRVTLLHLNDVYEIAPVSRGTQGGHLSFRIQTIETLYLP
jgi:hypothetical protein